MGSINIIIGIKNPYVFLSQGQIIVLEGIDKAGKGTQCKLLQNNILKTGLNCKILDFPDYSTNIGKEVRSFLDLKRSYSKEVQHMLLSANRWEKKGEIEKMLQDGTIIIMDRYYQSNLVYGLSNGLDLNWLLNLDKGLPKEDLVIVLEIDPKTSYNRVNYNRDLFEKNLEFLSHVKQNYQKLSKLYKWKIINGEETKEKIHIKISKIVKENLNLQF
ncbi:MAG TPA: dTMP kinase [Nitrososphaeraceae archaeon]|nr:dTMP kinase [Nitrososphaeraceae archaeon]